ncbi:hypothetical protein [Enterovibrio norvegicus]|uniref:hypothetical protein n=1 Tax=Enterovibrio norvegicus TaxID=188144 RepID=UPI0013047BFD|nr:hypothetical protein [Enterovibrio norvegicus]
MTELQLTFSVDDNQSSTEVIKRIVKSVTDSMSVEEPDFRLTSITARSNVEQKTEV